MLNLIEARRRSEFDAVFPVVNEYERSLEGMTCSARIEQSVDDLVRQFSPPNGRLILAVDGDSGDVAGCIAMKPHSADLCEMFRLYVRPEFRRLGLGHRLVERLITDATADGYSTMRLHTITALDSAIRLYRSFGFDHVEPFSSSRGDDQVYMALNLGHVD